MIKKNNKTKNRKTKKIIEFTSGFPSLAMSCLVNRSSFIVVFLVRSKHSSDFINIPCQQKPNN